MGSYLQVFHEIIVKGDKRAIQSLEIETEQTVLFWDILWYRSFVCMNCELYLGLQCACKTPWPTGFEKSKIHQPNAEKLQVEGCKIEAFLINFQQFPLKSNKNYSKIPSFHFYQLHYGISLLIAQCINFLNMTYIDMGLISRISL